MKLVILFLIGLIIIDIGITGNPGSFLAAFIDPSALQEVSSS